MSKLIGALLLTGALLASGGNAMAAGAAHQRVYFECGDTRIANFEDGPSGWSTTAPNATLAEGGGCAEVDLAGYSSSVGPVTATTARFAGTFTGNLHGMNVRLDTISAGTVQAGQRAEFDVTLLVDGQDALGGTRRLGVQPIPTAAGNGRIHSYFFSVIALPFVEPDQDRLHTVELTAEPVNQPLVAWTFGAKDVPSGIEFNPHGYHPYKVQPLP